MKLLDSQILFFSSELRPQRDVASYEFKESYVSEKANHRHYHHL